jgi:hypothetical protein
MQRKKMLQRKTQKVLKENLAKSLSNQKGRSYLNYGAQSLHILQMGLNKLVCVNQLLFQVDKD